MRLRLSRSRRCLAWVENPEGLRSTACPTPHCLWTAEQVMARRLPAARHLFQEHAMLPTTGTCPLWELVHSAARALALPRWGENRLSSPACPAQTPAEPRRNTKQTVLRCFYESSLTS